MVMILVGQIIEANELWATRLRHCLTTMNLAPVLTVASLTSIHQILKMIHSPTVPLKMLKILIKQIMKEKVEELGAKGLCCCLAAMDSAPVATTTPLKSNFIFCGLFQLAIHHHFSKKGIPPLHFSYGLLFLYLHYSHQFNSFMQQEKETKNVLKNQQHNFVVAFSART